MLRWRVPMPWRRVPTRVSVRSSWPARRSESNLHRPALHALPVTHRASHTPCLPHALPAPRPVYMCVHAERRRRGGGSAVALQCTSAGPVRCDVEAEWRSSARIPSLSREQGRLPPCRGGQRRQARRWRRLLRRLVGWTEAGCIEERGEAARAGVSAGRRVRRRAWRRGRRTATVRVVMSELAGVVTADLRVSHRVSRQKALLPRATSRLPGCECLMVWSRS